MQAINPDDPPLPILQKLHPAMKYINIYHVVIHNVVLLLKGGMMQTTLFPKKNPEHKESSINVSVISKAHH